MGDVIMRFPGCSLPPSSAKANARRDRHVTVYPDGNDWMLDITDEGGGSRSGPLTKQEAIRQAVAVVLADSATLTVLNQNPFDGAAA